ncbi:MAG: hypothetical protein R3C61_13860 [Bacteroidia bacterium]
MKPSQIPQIILAGLMPWLITACTSVRYSADTLLEEAGYHREIAILPVEIDYSGPAVSRFSDEDFREIDDRESRFYQESLYNSLLRKANKNVKVSVQPVERTNAVLRANKISIHESWEMDPAELARMLNVDAVVRLHVEESRYLSNAAGFGLELGRAVVFGPYNGPLPAGPIKTADVRVSCSIFDGDSGSLLWKLGIDQDASWNYTPEEIINNLNRRIARKFPYKY